jgi:hypothetical protein
MAIIIKNSKINARFLFSKLPLTIGLILLINTHPADFLRIDKNILLKNFLMADAAFTKYCRNYKIAGSRVAMC